MREDAIVFNGGNWTPNSSEFESTWVFFPAREFLLPDIIELRGVESLLLFESVFLCLLFSAIVFITYT